MKLEDQVVSLELAKRMKELGFEQESYFRWANINAKDGVVWDLYVHPSIDNRPHPDLWKFGISAYTVAELGEMLPCNAFSGKIKTTETTDPDSKELICFECWNNGFGGGRYYEDTEADARAKMLIYLKENNLL